MLQEDFLKDLLSQELGDREKVLICLAVEPVGPRKVKQIVELAFGSGWRQVKKKNVSSILSRSQGLAVLSSGGWELTTSGLKTVAALAGARIGGPVVKTAHSLRALIPKVSDESTRSFVEEAVTCFEARQFRAAIVLSWIGAMSILHHHVVAHKLQEFNAEASKRNSKWRAAKKVDDLGLIREHEFLDILQTISVVGKNVKQELKRALTLRNGCGHPNTLKVGEHKAASHIEDLILNVFAIF